MVLSWGGADERNPLIFFDGKDGVHRWQDGKTHHHRSGATIKRKKGKVGWERERTPPRPPPWRGGGSTLVLWEYSSG